MAKRCSCEVEGPALAFGRSSALALQSPLRRRTGFSHRGKVVRGQLVFFPGSPVGFSCVLSRKPLFIPEASPTAPSPYRSRSLSAVESACFHLLCCSESSRLNCPSPVSNDEVCTPNSRIVVPAFQFARNS